MTMRRADSIRTIPFTLTRAAATAGVLSLLYGASGARAADEIVIGASLPLSGPLAGFGSFQQWGYKHAVDEFNRKGGIAINGKMTPVRLVIRDDKTDPSTSAGNIETLISRDKVVALLGSCTPSLVNAGALVAERHKIPMVTGCDPILAFQSVRKWTYVWDLFFFEPDLAAAPFKTVEALNLKTNKKVAIFHDNGPDGQAIGGKIWPEIAKAAGYDVVQNASFPVDNTQFTSIIAEAKSKDADIVLVDAITPQAVAIRKQIASAGFTPKVLDIEKGAEPAQFAAALGKLADGVLVGGYWDPSLSNPGSAELSAAFEKETGQSSSQHIADSYTAASILLDALTVAGKTDAADVNEAISKTNKTYVVGPIKFDAGHTAALPIVMLQWQSGKPVIVWPKEKANGSVLFPAL